MIKGKDQVEYISYRFMGMNMVLSRIRLCLSSKPHQNSARSLATTPRWLLWNMAIIFGVVGIFPTTIDSGSHTPLIKVESPFSALAIYKLELSNTEPTKNMAEGHMPNP
jgi:hypothetical protein